MTAAGFDHVGVLVEDFAPARALAENLGLELAEPEAEPELGIEILWARAAGVAVEFIRPLHDDSRAAAALRAGEGGVHHVAFSVDVLDATLDALAAVGLRPRAGDPRPGAHGARIAFLDDGSVGGCRVELVEHPTPGPPAGARTPG